jgi:hypothetical protein
MKANPDFRVILVLLFPVIFLVLVCNDLVSQSITQTIKGKVTDAETQIPLPGATIVIIGSDPLTGTSANTDGIFRLEKVPLGRYDLKVTYTGYEPLVVSEIIVGSGKEVIINAGLKESVVSLGKVVVNAKADKKEAVNSMAIISARQINMEEARRFAGGFDDPSHLVSSYAGVAENMNSNGIVIRGNAPKGLLWRMEGLEISNPSHFANMTSFGGGGLTALSSQMLGSSDFYTGAFPAEFGNALSGVFDLKLRSGNADRYEHAVQAGLIGIDVSSEGPFKKGKGSTYLFNYRYSIFALIAPILPEDAGRIKYQDLSFKMDFPTKNAGRFSLWGIGSTDISGTKVEEEPAEWKYSGDQEEGQSRPYMGALGLTHKIIVGKKSFMNTSLALSGEGMEMKFDMMDSAKVFHPDEKIRNYSWKYSLSSYFNHKFSARHTNRTGFTIHFLNYDMLIQRAPELSQPLLSVVDDNGNSELLQGFSQSRFNLTEELTLNAGVHFQYFTLNRHYTLEPRFGTKWKFRPSQSLSLGYGSHSRLEMLFIYLAQHPVADGWTEPNRNLDFTKTHHLVLGYDLGINENIHFKAEAFYQHLYSVPVKPVTSYSLINLDQDWYISDSMTNAGTGDNYGIDLTLERFMNEGYYYIVTASIFKSTYKGGDGIARDARYDKNFVINFVGGKEWKVGQHQKNNTIGFNGKFSILGGDRITPVDEAATYAAKEVVYDDLRAFEDRKPNVFYLHFTLNYRKNKPRHASIWSLQVMNALGTPEFFGYKYNYKYNTLDKDQQVIVMPQISYKIEF